MNDMKKKINTSLYFGIQLTTMHTCDSSRYKNTCDAKQMLVWCNFNEIIHIFEFQGDDLSNKQ